MSILFVIGIFTVLVGMTAIALGHPLPLAITNAALVGAGVGIFEEFYVQTYRGTWLRSMHPLLSISIYTLVVAVLVVSAIIVSRLLIWRVRGFPSPFLMLTVAMPVFTAASIVGVLVVRVAHFLGIGTLFHLVVGTYHRPVIETKVLMFVDINGSTTLAERLGPLKTRALVGKFLFDISKPITDHGGEIYLYKGDGLIATWAKDEAIRDSALLRAVDAMFAAMKRERAVYRLEFDAVPAFRVGIHGGDVVVSEQGDDKRSIGIYGEVINIASRMEDAAKEHAAACVVSEAVARMMRGGEGDRFSALGEEKVRGISVPMRIYEYRPLDERHHAGH